MFTYRRVFGAHVERGYESRYVLDRPVRYRLRVRSARFVGAERGALLARRRPLGSWRGRPQQRQDIGAVKRLREGFPRPLCRGRRGGRKVQGCVGRFPLTGPLQVAIQLRSLKQIMVLIYFNNHNNFFTE